MEPRLSDSWATQEMPRLVWVLLLLRRQHRRLQRKQLAALATNWWCSHATRLQPRLTAARSAQPISVREQSCGACAQPRLSQQAAAGAVLCTPAMAPTTSALHWRLGHATSCLRALARHWHDMPLRPLQTPMRGSCVLLCMSGTTTSSWRDLYASTPVRECGNILAARLLEYLRWFSWRSAFCPVAPTGGGHQGDGRTLRAAGYRQATRHRMVGRHGGSYKTLASDAVCACMLHNCDIMIFLQSAAAAIAVCSLGCPVCCGGG